MLIAREKRRTNIAEYILYMWQVEDLLRACSFIPETIEKQLVQRFQEDEATSVQIASWYNSLAAAMEIEHVTEKGHLQAVSNLVDELYEFHLKLITSGKDPVYTRLYRKNQAEIAEFALKSGDSSGNEVLICLNALYSFMLLKLKNAEISVSTFKTMQGFAGLIGHLSARYIQFENDDFEF